MSDPPALAFLRRVLGGQASSREPQQLVNKRRRFSWKEKLKKLVLATGVGSSVRWPDPSGLWFRQARVLLLGCEKKFDMVFSTFGPPGAHLLADWYVRRHSGLAWVADFRDLWTRNHHFPGMPGLRWFEARLEMRVLRAATLVTTVSEPLAQSLREESGDKVRVVFNGYDPDDWRSLPALPSRKARLELFYGGSYYPGRMRVEPFLDALERLRKEGLLKPGDLRADFCGPRTDAIVAMAHLRGLQEFVTGGDVRARAEVLAAQQVADVLLFFGYQDEHSRDEGILTGKLFEYLGAERAILGIALSEKIEAGRLIVESGRGELVGSEPDAVRAALVNLLREGVGSFREPSSRIKGLTREHQARRLLEMLSDQCGG